MACFPLKTGVGPVEWALLICLNTPPLFSYILVLFIKNRKYSLNILLFDGVLHHLLPWCTQLLFWEMYCEILVWICRFWKCTISRHLSFPFLTLSTVGDFKSFFTAFHKLNIYQNTDIRKIPFVCSVFLLCIKIVGLLA